MKINSDEVLILRALREMPRPRWAAAISDEIKARFGKSLSVSAIHSLVRSMRMRGLVTAKDSRDDNGLRRIEFTATTKASRSLDQLREVLNA